MARLLLVDDEERFRTSLAERLKLRDLDVVDVSDGEAAIKAVRRDTEIDVVILDRRMPGIGGEEVLTEIKRYRPEIQVIFLTGHGSLDSAMEVGRHDAYTYLEKPCDLDRLVTVIEEARADLVHARVRHEIPEVKRGSPWRWLVGSANSRPGVIMLGLLLFVAIICGPTPSSMTTLLSTPKTGQTSDPHVGYSDYGNMETGETITDFYAHKYHIGEKARDAESGEVSYHLTPDGLARRAKVMLGILVVAALFWITGAVPIGVTALTVGVGMYFMGVLQPNDVARAYAKDAVIFIFGVLAMARVISNTGLDRRIGLLMMVPAKSLPRYLFIFLPIFAVTCSFLSEHALVAFLVPMLMLVYVTSTRQAGVRRDPALAVMLILALNYAANCGGPGSPAAGGRNAVMIGILSDYGVEPSFGEWVRYGLPFVPVMALVIGAYFYLVMRHRIKTRQVNSATICRQASDRIGAVTQKEKMTAVVLAGLVLLWITCSDRFGMGGPVILALVVLNFLRVLRWRDVVGIHWEIVALYASACAMGKGLAVTGAALFLADGFVGILPDVMRSGEGLALATAVFTGLATNFMSDGATVSAIGPITVPMSIISGTPPWMVGFTTAFASSFAHLLVIGTPNNAIVYALARDPATGEQLITLKDFLRHGSAVLLLSFVVLFGWTILGYWRWLGF